MNFTIYRLDSGDIERVVDIPEENLSLQFDPETHAAIPGALDDRTHRVVDGTAVPIEGLIEQLDIPPGPVILSRQR